MISPYHHLIKEMNPLSQIGKKLSWNKLKMPIKLNCLRICKKKWSRANRQIWVFSAGEFIKSKTWGFRLTVYHNLNLTQTCKTVLLILLTKWFRNFMHLHSFLIIFKCLKNNYEKPHFRSRIKKYNHLMRLKWERLN